MSATERTSLDVGAWRGAAAVTMAPVDDRTEREPLESSADDARRRLVASIDWRCPQCDYDLTGADSAHCSECGCRISIGLRSARRSLVPVIVGAAGLGAVVGLTGGLYFGIAIPWGETSESYALVSIGAMIAAIGAAIAWVIGWARRCFPIWSQWCLAVAAWVGYVLFVLWFAYWVVS